MVKVFVERDTRALMDPILWKQAEKLFLGCADLSPSGQQEFLDQRCEGEPELRQAVTDLLQGDAAGDAIQQSIGQAAGELSTLGHDRWKGAEMGAYTLEARIAEGGMGLIYLARRSDRQYEQKVAVKLLPTALISGDMRARFLAERQILANLSHTNIAKLIDGGETEDGVPYLVMEYIDGIPIDQFCNVNRLTPAQRIALFVQVCAAVHYAHRNLVIHRDIKPSNILVTREGVPKLLDFGIAKLLDEGPAPADAAVTMVGNRLLTPRHASPEQILGDPVTTASDVYSLGLLLYELLCGAYPYRVGHTTHRRDLERTVTETAPLPPSGQLGAASGVEDIARSRRSTVEKLRRFISGDLDTIVLKALRKEPEARYATAQEFAEDLRRFSENQPILARPPTTSYLLSRYWLRHRTAAIGILATLVAVIAGGTTAAVGFIEARESERVAVIEAQNAAAISSFLVSLLREADPKTSVGQERSVREMLDLGLQRVNSELQDSPAIKALVLETLSSVYKALAEYPLAEDLLRQALAAHEKSGSGDVIASARMLNDIGDLLRIQSRHSQAADFIERSLKLHRDSGSPVNDDYADAVNNLSLVYEESGRFDYARTTMEEALRLRTALFGAPHPKIALSLHNLAWHYERRRNFAEAERHAKQAIAMRAELFGEDHPRAASTIELLSRIYRAQGKWGEAEAEARRAVAIAEKEFPTGHPDLTYPLYQLAKILHEKGQIRDARDRFAQIVAWEQVSLGMDSHDVGMSIRAHADTLEDLAEYEQAESQLREALDIFMSLPDGSAHALYDTRTRLAGVLLKVNRLEEAGELLGTEGEFVPGREASFRRRLVMADLLIRKGDLRSAEAITAALVAETDDQSHTDLLRRAEALNMQALALLPAERTEEALESLNTALTIYLDHWGPEHWRAAATRTILAEAMLGLQQNEAARQHLETAMPVLERVLGDEHPETRRAAKLIDSAPPSRTIDVNRSADQQDLSVIGLPEDGATIAVE